MPTPQIDFDTYLKRIPTHTQDLPEDSRVPRLHYRRSANDAWNLLIYIERNIADVNVYRASYERHMRRLSTMVLLSLVEAFERFLDETVEAINCAVVGRLAELLTTLHTSDSSLIVPDVKAQELANLFRIPCTVSGQTRGPR